MRLACYSTVSCIIGGARRFRARLKTITSSTCGATAASISTVRASLHDIKMGTLLECCGTIRLYHGKLEVTTLAIKDVSGVVERLVW